MSEPDFGAAEAAYQEWARLKRKSDETLRFGDCHKTAQAWVRFQNLYLGYDNPLAVMPKPSATVIPLHGGDAA